MAIITAREFNQDTSAAKRSATTEPLIITDRGEPSFVLLTYAEYQQLTGGVRSIVDMLRQDERGDFDMEFPPAHIESKAIDL
ncbi:type II toxin-antitoxin system Phd/YefM family antitoxin [Leifsonia shinshuensis]|uniref:type II toxin-antitoxin system Phd/YefM family antitoxin n=1 Tax=Leifsonia shinshuensis TaxID=150026 RepID=UPI00285F7FE1|nr:type II toxin-antitoxin system Phd/YefM family antitoxin [Leifsonia shinshuensis]MDR6970164.1 prevent-host-death family protein [Leifsonia shinshuensis]